MGIWAELLTLLFTTTHFIGRRQTGKTQRPARLLQNGYLRYGKNFEGTGAAVCKLLITFSFF
jgi:hypothetical protein